MRIGDRARIAVVHRRANGLRRYLDALGLVGVVIAMGHYLRRIGCRWHIGVRIGNGTYWLSPDELQVVESCEACKQQLGRGRDRKHNCLLLAHERTTTGLGAQDISDIRAGHKAGYSSRVMGRMYGVSHTTILNILRGKTWRGY